MGFMYIIIGLVCVFSAVYCFGNAAKIMNGRKVKGVPVDYAEVRKPSGSGKVQLLYSPVYEYEDGGEIKLFTSKKTVSYQESFGTEVILLIAKNGEVSD